LLSGIVLTAQALVSEDFGAPVRSLYAVARNLA
jgi:hypothetical protein